MRATRHLPKYERFGGPSPQEGDDLGTVLVTPHQVPILGVHGPGIAESAAPRRDDGNLVQPLMRLQVEIHQGMARLVVGHDFAFARRDALGVLEPEAEPLDGPREIRLARLFAAGPYRQDAGLVDHVGEVGPTHVDRGPRQRLEIDALFDLDLAGVVGQQGFASLEVGKADMELPVEAARPQEGGVQALLEVSRGDGDDVAALAEAVEFDEELVEGLIGLLVAEHAARAGSPQGVDLVDEDDGGRMLAGLGVELADPARAHPDEDFDEVRAGQRVEGDSGLVGDRLGQQGLARPRRPDQQDPLGNLGADPLVLPGIR
ncbi:hypothetical protein D3C87_1091040 [compost metagenome]